MNIKNKLKELDIKLSDFAIEAEISRPTLNNYILIFEKGEVLPNEKYQLMFEKLFNNKIDSKEEFLKVLKRFHHLLERDKVLGTIEFNTKTTDLITSILNRIKDDLQENDFEESIYIFINMLIGNYRREPIFTMFSKYFLYLNNKNSLEQISDSEKVFISNCYKLMSLEKEKKLVFDEEYYKKFELRVKELINSTNEEKKRKAREIFKKSIEKKINLEIQDQLELGVDIEDIDVDKIINKIGFIKEE